MDKIINFGLISRPENWVIIWLVLYLTALLARVVLDAIDGVNPVVSATS